MILFADIGLIAQSNNPIKSFDVVFIRSDQSIINPFDDASNAPVAYQNSNFKVLAIIQLSDTTNVASFDLKLESDNLTLRNETVDFDPLSLPRGMTYGRKGHFVYVGLGTFANLTDFEIEYSVKDAQQISSPSMTFQQN